MSMQKKLQMVEVVLFFNDSGVCKEMLYFEFEVLFDGLVCMLEYVDWQMYLVYVLINLCLQVWVVVFFYFDFDEQGGVDIGWNLFLCNFVECVGCGFDMGGGLICLVCCSQCLVFWYQMYFWDLESSVGCNYFVFICDVFRCNQLGLLVDEEFVVVELQWLQMVVEE